MKKYPFFLAAALPVLLFLFSSCKKEDDTPKTKTELLTQASWKYKSATVAGTPYNNFNSCQKDNILSFSVSGNGAMDEGATTCNAGDPQSMPFTWVFQNGETLIQFSSPLYTNGDNTVTLVSVTETQLVLIIPITTLGPTFLVEVTFEH